MSDDAFTPGQGVPARLVAGDLWSWRVDQYQITYPANAVGLSYAFAPVDGGSVATFSASADVDGWVVSVASATSATLSAGRYTWTLFATRLSDGGRATICTGTVEITPDPTLGADTRSQARRHLDAINAVLDRRITKDVENYTIEGRALTRTPLEILHKLRARYMAEVQAEDRRAKGKSGVMKVRKVRF